MPRLVLVGDTSAGDNFFAFHTTCSELFLVARRAVDLFVFRYKAFRTDSRLAQGATETFVVPLFPFVFHFLHARSKYFAAPVAARRERCIVAIGAKDFLILRTERLVHQRDLAHATKKAHLVPVLLLVR